VGRRQKLNQAWVALLVCGLTLSACTVLPNGRTDLDVGIKERGIASWYGEEFHGWLTANGEIYNMDAFTAAHRVLPLGTVVRVVNVENGRQVRVRINDRGPYLSGRVIDLSRAAAKELDMMDSGIAAVQLEVIGEPQPAQRIRSVPVVLRLINSKNCATAGNAMVFVPSRKVRAVRLLPTDIIRERRVRRVSDVLAADHRAYSVASLSVV
jgi:rare lipoprotein A